LIAEERDYKRRRMSYRGKKTNQSPLQVRSTALVIEIFYLYC